MHPATTTREERLREIARALAERDLDTLPASLRAVMMTQAELNLRARERFLASHALVPATAVAERLEALEIPVDGVAHYPACLLDGTKPSALALRLLDAAKGYNHGWSLVLWLGAPNRWLDGRPPVELLESDPAAVERAMELDHTPIG